MFMHDHALNRATVRIHVNSRRRKTATNLERLGRDGRVVAAALAEVFSTSEDTIRRDLRDLAGRGLCRRVYGGALPVSPATSSAQVRAGEATDRKAALGLTLAALVVPGSLVFVDSGSTNLAAAIAFPDLFG